MIKNKESKLNIDDHDTGVKPTGFPFASRRRLMFKNIFHDINTMFRNYKYISHGHGLMWIIWVNEGTRGKVTLYL